MLRGDNIRILSELIEGQELQSAVYGEGLVTACYVHVSGRGRYSSAYDMKRFTAVGCHRRTGSWHCFTPCTRRCTDNRFIERRQFTMLICNRENIDSVQSYYISRES